MKVRELMQGDKVYETSLGDAPQVVTVEEIGQNHIYVGFSDDDMALLRYEPEHLGFDIKGIEPIPITDEILRLNGFNQTINEHLFEIMEGDYEIYVNTENHCVVIAQFTEDGEIFRLRFFCEYIHDFQHALRLCEANYFSYKIKIQPDDAE